ncbi:MAG: TIGR01777 family oxidoreductase [candidate division KSB1 bacterium]|nr:TIGR01777 family oxidoreductase [candidate division KSB1 bacterium]MDZ7273415.1 TIGR01777 family oxidoreductase [candidate division KSB1 bacterium]MDZ7286992.1 TIGR01777 family oxidoreductase [candidate division KSB1 bacterium]MDZ7299655.1 TIGR01777 family oxidoreductase [candidate division KSB1 bacterium]MDZ7350768.1 TIGR01777 family oxidoreductase [candidate division KSB1 bacterium]
MKVLVTGSTGLIGSALITALHAQGHQVVRLVRQPVVSNEPAVKWDPAAGTIDAAGLEGLDAVVHLAGESIASRWTAAKKRRIRDSRVAGTQLLAQTLAALKQPPRTLISVSAIGYYGDRGDMILREDSGPGTGFLAETSVAWEQAAQPAVQAGIRVAHPRIGIVLTTAGGALQQMLLPFRLGIGGVLGSGKQYWSWIAFEDVIGGLLYALHNENLRGPFNLVAPQPVTNREFTKTLGRVLARPTFLPAPEFALRLLLGEMAEGLLFASARVEPAKLLDMGYRFRYPALEEALRALFR